MKFILAGTAQEAQRYINRNRLDRREYTYVVSPVQLIGQNRGATMIRLGTWREREDLHIIERMVLERQLDVRDAD